METTNETVADIVKEMRLGDYGCAKCGDLCDCPNTDKIIASIANRIEAAHKREVAELRECLKEAMGEKCRSCKDEWYGRCMSKDGGDCELIAKWRKAL